jgi:hypothetical protein
MRWTNITWGTNIAWGNNEVWIGWKEYYDI